MTGLAQNSLPAVSGTDPSKCVFDTFRIAIANTVTVALPQLSIEKVYLAVDYGKKTADFTIALPRLGLKENDDAIAAQIIGKFKPDGWIESISHDKAFLHFRLNSLTMIRAVLTQVQHLTYSNPSGKSEYGCNDSGNGKRVIIEFSSPNIAKEFHVGHLRSTIIGAVLVNVYKSCGWETISMNYLGDWGTQFGIVATGFERYGSEEELEKDPIKHLSSVYVQATRDCDEDEKSKAYAANIFKRMEDRDEEPLKNWRRWRQISVDKYLEAYERLNVSFDVYTGESMVEKNTQVEVMKTLAAGGFLHDFEGAESIDLTQYKLGKVMLRKRDGSSNYLIRDVAGAIERYEKYKFDKMIYVIASAQDYHVRQFFKILELMKLPWASSLLHVSFGLVLGMSTRKGTAVFLDDIIDQATQVMLDQMKKNAEKYQAIEDPENTSRELGLSAVKIQDMAAKRIVNYEFNWERMTSFEGDTGPYLQYAHVRLASLARKNPELLPLPPPADIDVTDLATSPHARNIAFLLGTYPDVVKTALKTHEPSGIVTFAFKLSHAISSAWETVAVKGEKDVDKARARLWMYLCARDVLGAAIRLLTVRPLERM